MVLPYGGSPWCFPMVLLSGDPTSGFQAPVALPAPRPFIYISDLLGNSAKAGGAASGFQVPVALPAPRPSILYMCMPPI